MHFNFRALGLSLAVATAAAGHAFLVDARANLFGAGYGDTPDPGGGGGGVLAPSIVVIGGGYVTFSVTGTASGGAGGPDGYSGTTNINSYRSISGILASRKKMLCGVFLDDGVPAAAPARLDFRSSGLGMAFASLAPELGQMFFIGDGMTGTNSGAVQEFYAPAGATRLFLGIADAWNHAGDPGWYDDNIGELEVNATVVPEPASGWIVGIGIAAALRRRFAGRA